MKTKTNIVTLQKKVLYIIISILTLGFAPLLAQQKQKGKASYYSRRATGARTSSGERLHHDSLTCAHRTYPFGTKLKVTNPANGRWVVVRVTDRGPYGRNRIIDLSYRAAKELGMLTQGVAMVLVEPIKDMIVPFKPSDDKLLMEIDFERTDDDIDDKGHPAWQDYNKKGQKANDKSSKPEDKTAKVDEKNGEKKQKNEKTHSEPQKSKPGVR